MKASSRCSPGKASIKSSESVPSVDTTPVHMTDCMPPIMSGFPFNRNSWHEGQRLLGDAKRLQRQESVERTPSPPPKNLPIFRHNHSLKYSGGALHGSIGDSPKLFDHNYVEESSSTQSEESGLVSICSRQRVSFFFFKTGCWSYHIFPSILNTYLCARVTLNNLNPIHQESTVKQKASPC